MSRTINIAVTNWSGVSLSAGDAKSQEGPAATFSPSSTPNGGSITATAYNNSLFNGGNKGTFVLSNSSTGASYTIFYTHPQTTGASYISLQSASTGGVAGIGQPTYSGDPINATMNVYAGVPVQTGGTTLGYVTPLFENAYTVSNNCQDLANSVFNSATRSGALIEAAFNQSTTPYMPADFTGGQLATTLVDVLYNCFTSGSGADWPILKFLADYIAPIGTAAPMTMWVPLISYQGGNPSIYQISGYQSFELVQYNGGTPVWNPAEVRTFLTLLAGGAHFVAVSAYDDLTSQGIATSASRALYTAFQNSGLSQREDFANSHYCNAILYNNTGYYYLSNITQQWAPPGCGLILSLLFGSTINDNRNPPAGSFNTFMQLEGWPASGVTGGDRHSADYDAYKQTLWNTATYGACPYSEKRATTVFLAPQGWTPTIYQTTLMMPYVGAYASGTYPNGEPQSWLNTEVATVPAGTPPLPSTYYT